jgi:tetratricopeptide (TPR) repeat protein
MEMMIIILIVGVVTLFFIGNGGKGDAEPVELPGKVEDYLADAIKCFNENRLRYAEKSYKLALIKAKQVGAPDRMFGRILFGLGTVYTAQGRYQDAEGLLKEARHLYQVEYGVSDLRLASVIQQLATNALKHNQLNEAETLFEECIAIQEEALNKDHPEVLKTLTQLGHVYYAKDNFEMAEDCYSRALESLINGRKPLSIEQMQDFQHLVDIYKTTDRPSEALDLEDKLRKMTLQRAS